jgi:amino acid transporter
MQERDELLKGVRGRRKTWRRYLFTHRHSALLGTIVAAMAVRPMLGDTKLGPPFFSVAILLILLVAVYNINVDALVGDRKALLRERRRRNIILLVLGLPAIVDRFAVFLAPSHWRFMVGSISWLLFLAAVTWHQLRALLRQKQITSETISMSVSVYLLIGFTWGLFYIVLFQLQPNSFSFPSAPPSSATEVLPVLLYFSLTTLSTIGFGDIVPLTLQVRYAAVTEGIMGQFYIAILVARLVSLQMSQSESRRAEPTVDEPDNTEAAKVD